MAFMLNNGGFPSAKNKKKYVSHKLDSMWKIRNFMSIV